MEQKRRTSVLTKSWRLALAAVAVLAVVQELRKPKSERQWHGKVADLVPYDFRKPTLERMRATFWNPDGPIISGRAFGVGWSPNFGALTRLARGGSRSPGV